MRHPLVLAAALAVAALLGACGTQDPPAAAPTATTPATTTVRHHSAHSVSNLGPAIDPDADRWSLSMVDATRLLPLAARSGRRADHRVPPRLLRGRHDANLVRAALAEIWTDVDPGGDSLRTLNAAQRAAYALTWADTDLRSGGFFRLIGDNAAAPLLRDLHATALRVGAPAPLATLYAQVRAFAPKAHTPDDWARFDRRYALLQRHRDTSLAHVVAAYIARHPRSFTVGS